MVLQDQFVCKDFDECAPELGTCGQNCTNNKGSYYCSCVDGYILDRSVY